MRTLIIQHDHDGYPGALLAPIEAAGEVVRWDTYTHPERPSLDDITAVVSLGGTAHPDQDHAEPWLAAELDLLEEALDTGVPILGVCLGGQLLARAAGGRIGKVDVPEVARFVDVGLTADADDDLLLAGMPRPFFGFEWHWYGFEAPPGATLLARNDSTQQAFRFQNRAWGLQFHIEVTAATLAEWAAAAPDTIEEHGGRERFDKTVETFIDQSTAAAKELAERFMVVAAVSSGEVPADVLASLEVRPDPIAEAQAAGVPPDVIEAMARMRAEQQY
ncbi:MAG: type 1 glutamine amidotransferase [Gaiellales bacterium]